MSYFEQVNPDQTRWNGPGGHHDRFLTNSEMLLLGVTLWRTAQWVRENQRRLTPQEKAQYDIEVQRWKAYLEWEERTPGAKEAREEYVYAQQAQAQIEYAEGERAFRRIFLWRPATLALLWVIAHGIFFPVPDMAGEPEPPTWVFWVVLFGTITVWAFGWHFCMMVKASYRRVRYEQAMVEAAVQSRPGNLPVPWEPQRQRSHWDTP